MRTLRNDIPENFRHEWGRVIDPYKNKGRYKTPVGSSGAKRSVPKKTLKVARLEIM